MFLDFEMLVIVTGSSMVVPDLYLAVLYSFLNPSRNLKFVQSKFM